MTDPELAALCEREHPRLVGLLLLHVGDRATAEELAQEALLRVCQRWSRVRRLDRPGAWAATVATNLARSTLRRRAAERRARTRHGASPEVHADADPGVALAVANAVAALPERQRTAIAYRYYAGFTVAEAAAAMRITPGTVRALCHQAIGALRASGLAVDEHDPEEVMRDASA